ncbi:uncharacterized protein K452DRAFT_139286 [Aplosporella prunicola CBS 121167]|uniref:Uncharacterized protein n=1 Tax=Aplosporella prunicola CBS 121167 TaxID=1176127 RepID=A0A6A6AW44_9PEZI|nr:uncharacterized protein K452DRAFT_139286 [Aplosporella prunicola CBS 121167]KAF2136222.1 hypothetical protein K452DRAFT_139286 [Aplosporella prunicola CBS 121167]
MYELQLGIVFTPRTPQLFPKLKLISGQQAIAVSWLFRFESSSPKHGLVGRSMPFRHDGRYVCPTNKTTGGSESQTQLIIPRLILRPSQTVSTPRQQASDYQLVPAILVAPPTSAQGPPVQSGAPLRRQNLHRSRALASGRTCSRPLHWGRARRAVREKAKRHT